MMAGTEVDWDTWNMKLDVDYPPLVCKGGNASDNGKMNKNVATSNMLSETKDAEKLYPQPDKDGGIVEAVMPFNLLVKVPRFDDGSLEEEISLLKLEVDEKMRVRDAIQIQIREERAKCQIHGLHYEYAKGKVRKARRLVKSKRMEIDSLLNVINKAKYVSCIEDINSEIQAMEHKIQHETLSLKQENKLILKIKQLKEDRESLLAALGSQDEIEQILEHKDVAEDRLKILRKELDILKDSIVEAEAAVMEAETKYDMENKQINELQAKYKDVGNVCQAAYIRLQTLRRNFYVKNKYFFKYKDDVAAAKNHAFSRNNTALHGFCTNQVQNFMELWNTKDEFRQQYVKFNARSTVTRLGTLDGRSLGPDEKPPVLPDSAHERVDRFISTSPADSKIMVSQTVTFAHKMLKKTTEDNNQKAKKEAEEKERQEAEAKLKVECRLEASQIQKLKEAEQKEKKREKRLKKKERRQAVATDTNDINTYEIAPSSKSCVETTKESEVVKDVFGKQGKTKTVPSTLRSAVILVLFWLRYVLGVFTNLKFKRSRRVM